MTYQQAPDLQRVSRLERFAQRHKRGLESLFAWTLLAAFAALNAFILVTTSREMNEALSAPETRLTASKESLTTQASDQPDPCGLKDVVCEQEKAVFMATVTTYQAVKGQTDGDPCTTADGTKICPLPPFGVVANNCLPFDTAVMIRNALYFVHDRMNSRYGCDAFDVLTDGENYKLTHEYVIVL